MRNPLRRYYSRGDLHFLTFSCYRRRPYLGTIRARNCFVRVLKETRQRFGFQLLGYVVMPEHVHLLVSEPKKGDPSKVLQVLKQKVSRRLRGGQKRKRAANQLALRFCEDFGDAEHFWQRRFYDFNVWSERKLKEKLECMHANPVVRKLVDHPKEWPWSSWSHYAEGERGLIAMDLFEDRSKTGENPHP
jgi:putative transposase